MVSAKRPRSGSGVHPSLNQPADQLARFSGRLAVAAVKRLGEVDNYAAIMLCDPWMQRYRGGRYLGC